MPITQDRWLRLLQAGEAYRTSFAGLRSVFATMHQDIREGKLTKAEAFDQLYFQISTIMDTDAAVILTEERVKYNSNRVHNDWQQRHQERKRRMKGMKPHKPRNEPYLDEKVKLVLNQIEATDNMPETIDFTTPDQNPEYIESVKRGRK